MRLRSVLQVGLIVMAAVLAYGAIGTWLVPWLAKPRIERAVGESLGRALTIGELRVYPYQFRAQAREIVLAGASEGEQLRVAKLSVDYDPRSLFGPAHRLNFLRVERPELHVVRGADGRFDLPVPRSAPVDEPADSEPLAWRIEQLALDDGRLRYVDRTGAAPLSLAFDGLGFSARDLAVDPTAEDGRIALRLREAGGAELLLGGDFHPHDGSARVVVTLRGLHRELSNAVLAQAGLPALDAFGADATVVVERAADGRIALHDGALVVRPLAVVDGDGRWALDALAVTDMSVDIDARRIMMDTVGVAGGSLPLVRRADGSVDVTALIDRWAGAGEGGSLEVAHDPTAGVGAAATDAGSTGEQDSSVDIAIPPMQPDIATTSAPAGAVAALDADATASAVASGWDWRIQRIAASAIALPLRDDAVTPPVELPVRLHTVNVGPLAGAMTEPAQLALAAAIGDGGTLRVGGPVHPFEGLAELAIGFDGLALPVLAPYVAGLARVELRRGELGGELALTLAPAGSEPRVGIDGRIAISGFETVDAARGRELVSWRRLDVEDIEASVEPTRVAIGRVRADRLFARVIIGADRRTNLADLATEPVSAADTSAADASASVAAADPGPASGPTPFRIDRIDFTRSRMRFADLSLTPRFITTIEAIEGGITGLSSAPGARSSVDLRGQVDAYAPVTISGSLNPFRGAENTDVALVFRNVELTTLTPYSARFAGYAIDRGKLDLDLGYVVRAGRLEGSNRVVLDQLTLGAPIDSDEATSLPLKLIIALLKDSEGRIDLDIPVEGDLNDPKVRTGPLIRQAVVAVLTKIVTAPFALLAGLAGDDADADALSRVRFAPGIATPMDSEVAKFPTLRAGLAKRPTLRLTIRGIADPVADRRALAEAALQAALGPPGADVAADRTALLRVHAERIGGEPAGAPEAPGWLADDAEKLAYEAALTEWFVDVRDTLRERFEIDDAELRRLAEARAAAIRDALLADGAIAPERVFLAAVAVEPGHATVDGVDAALDLDAP
jgi:hypothetical protein